MLEQSPQSETGYYVGCTREDFGDDGQAKVERDASVKIAEMLIFGKIHHETVGKSHGDEWRCYGNGVEKSSFCRFHISNLRHEHGKDNEDSDEYGREEGNCSSALWVQDKWILGFAGFDSSIYTKTHPRKTEDANALENKPGYGARNECVSVLHVRSIGLYSGEESLHSCKQSQTNKSQRRQPDRDADDGGRVDAG